MGKLFLGTCSWNYDSWEGLVYTNKCRSAAEYLNEYSKHFDTAEIDSWFYKIPSQKEVIDYKNYAKPNFRFTCKAPEQISLTHHRNYNKSRELITNPDFLSYELFSTFINAIEPLLPQIDCIMFEFEYLNQMKMSSLNAFLDQIGSFIKKVETKNVPIGIETRNKNYLCNDYFTFLKEYSLIPVFSEKQFMPHIYEVYNKYSNLIENNVVIRLLGGDRKEIELKTNQQWNKIVEEKNDKHLIAQMANDIIGKGMNCIINVNNHFEGSAPLTIQAIRSFFV
jgi:uncharacterized protein YecE (DUF72 family)